MRTSFAGSTEYSGKQFAWFQTPPEPGKGAHSKVLGILLPAVPQPPVSAVLGCCFWL